MANEKAVLFIGANKPIVGRDQDAINLWIETPSWLDRQMRANWFQRYDGIWLTAHGGTMNSAWMCYGERARMDEWRRSDEFEAWIFRAQMCLEDLCVCPGVTQEGIRDAMDRRKRALSGR
jgi:hypothetical protein